MRASPPSTCCSNRAFGHGLCFSSPSSVKLPPRVSAHQKFLKLFADNWMNFDSKCVATAAAPHCSNRRRNTVATLSSPGPSSAWDEKPYQVLPNGKIEYLDEQDVVTFLDPPKDLIPLEPSSYNPAAYLWKKIEDIPEERRHRLLSLLKQRLISRAWEVAGMRYDDPKLAKKSASALLSNGGHAHFPEFWNCQTTGGPPAISWIRSFRKGVFCCKDGKKYGRLIGGLLLSGTPSSLSPLYFAVTQLTEVMSTEQPCDFAYELGDGLWDLPDYPEDFPKPAKHPWPFNDEVVIYIRHVGPGVLVGQAWQEGEALQQVPQKLCGEILMVKDYFV